MKRIRGIFPRLIACLLGVVLLLTGAIGAWATTAPAVGSDRYYLDLGEVLPTELKAELISWNAKNKDTAEIVIVTVKSLDGADLTTFCQSIYDTWEIGTKEQSKGLLLLMTLEENSYLAIAGAGVSTHFSAGGLDQLLATQVEPDFSAQRYGNAAQKFFTATSQLLTDSTTAQPTPAPASGISGAIWGFVQALLIIIGIALALGVIFIVITVLRSKRRKTSRSNRRQSRTSSHRRSPPRKRTQEHPEKERAPQDQPEDTDEQFDD